LYIYKAGSTVRRTCSFIMFPLVCTCFSCVHVEYSNVHSTCGIWMNIKENVWQHCLSCGHDRQQNINKLRQEILNEHCCWTFQSTVTLVSPVRKHFQRTCLTTMFVLVWTWHNFYFQKYTLFYKLQICIQFNFCASVVLYLCLKSYFNNTIW